MQTFNVQVEDDFMQEFLNFVQSKPKEIHIEDPNLALDPYFYTRQKKLNQLREDIKNGKMEMIEEEDFWQEMDEFVAKL